MEKEKTIKKEAIEHYDRMIEWAMSQDPEGEVNPTRMLAGIGEVWFSQHCSYCEEYYTNGDCPLAGMACVGGFYCCGKLWGEMHESKTWGEFSQKAILVRKYILENG